LEKLGRYVAESSQPSDPLRDLVELHLIDTVGAWIASTRTSEGANLLRFRAMVCANGRAGEALALDLATRCALARLSEIDNIHLPSMTTPGAIVIPGALTLAAATADIAADDLIAAIIAGTEAMTRLGRALDGPSILYRGIWPTYFAAPFAMAAVAARLLRLDAESSAHAATQALKEIIAGGVAPSAIEEVTVAVLPPHRKMIDHGVVAGDRVSHLTSVQYCMAVAALAPEAAFDIQQAPAKIPSAVQALMAKIKVQADERLLAEYPRSWPARVRVTAGAGRQERTVTH